jgi:DNA mismatch repair protein MutL
MPKGPAPKYNPFYNPFKQKATKDWEQLYEQLPQQPASSETSLFQTDEELVQQKSSDAQPLELTDISPSHYQYKGHYIMTAVKSGLMIIDQYRADVRIRYERYMNQLSHSPSQSQRLLFPEVLEMAPSDAALMDELQPLLTAVGFELTPLGPASFAINGVPAGIEGLNPSSLIQDIVAAAVPVNHDSLALNSEVALQLARHAAIPYGQQLTNEEMDVLVNDLFACSNVNYTPDGHPILCILPQQDIEQLLG